jgi:hypothetical protein
MVWVVAKPVDADGELCNLGVAQESGCGACLKHGLPGAGTKGERNSEGGGSVRESVCEGSSRIISMGHLWTISSHDWLINICDDRSSNI